MSYFDVYFNSIGEKTLRELFPAPRPRRFDARGWMTTDEDLGYIGDALDTVPPLPGADAGADPVARARPTRTWSRAGLLGANAEGLLEPAQARAIAGSADDDYFKSSSAVDRMSSQAARTWRSCGRPLADDQPQGEPPPERRVGQVKPGPSAFSRLEKRPVELRRAPLRAAVVQPEADQAEGTRAP